MRIDRRLSRAAAGIAAALTLALFAPAVSHAGAAKLYAVTGADDGDECTGTDSSLYTLDPTNGDATLVGAVMIGATQARHITGLAVHPVTGTLYAIMNGNQADCSDAIEATLLTIDPATGAATIIGSQGSVSGQFSDITFDPFGTLYGWDNEDSELIVIDITNGTGTGVGDRHNFSLFEDGMASDSKGRLYLVGQYVGPHVLLRLNQYTAAGFDAVELDNPTDDILTFDVSDSLYTGKRTETGFDLMRITDLQAGTTSVVGSNTIKFISAIEFERGLVTAPAVADLSLTKEIDEPFVAIGESVVFTLELSNAGPGTGTNVVVSDVLPNGFSYVSQSGDGSYDETTGEWTVASIDASTSKTIEITALVEADDDRTNIAEVVDSDSYDSDSVPGSGDTESDTYASVTATLATNTLFSIDGDTDRLWRVDPERQDAEMAHTLTNPTHSVCRGHGLATQPKTQALFAVLGLDDCESRYLVTIAPDTGETTTLGNFAPRQVDAIVFADQDTLYAATGNGGQDGNTLFTVDPADGTLTQKCRLNEGYGRALLFHDGLLYSAVENLSDAHDTITIIDPSSFPVDPADPCGGTDIDATLVGHSPTAMRVDSFTATSVTLWYASYDTIYVLTIDNGASPAVLESTDGLQHSTRGFASNRQPITAGNLVASKSAVKMRSKGVKTIDYQIGVFNSGPDAIDNVALTDELPAGTSFVSADAGCNEIGGVVTCDAGTLTASSSSYFHFTVTVTCKKCSSIFNAVSVSADADYYDNPFDNQSTVTTAIKGKF